jgi:hypothetical protein
MTGKNPGNDGENTVDDGRHPMMLDAVIATSAESVIL